MKNVTVIRTGDKWCMSVQTERELDQPVRKRKFSRNWLKVKAKVERLHRKIANVRKDYLHKVTTAISKNHAVVFVEDLRAKDMTKSAVGTVEHPGKNVRAKAGW